MSQYGNVGNSFVRWQQNNDLFTNPRLQKNSGKMLTILWMPVTLNAWDIQYCTVRDIETSCYQPTLLPRPPNNTPLPRPKPPGPEPGPTPGPCRSTVRARPGNPSEGGDDLCCI
jgi:hypothetical protein